MDIKKCHQPHQDAIIPNTHPLNTKIWCRILDSKERGWKQATCLWDDMPPPYTGCEQTGQNTQHQNHRITEPRPRCAKQNRNKTAKILWPRQKNAPDKIQKMAMEGNVKGHRPRGRPSKRWLDCISQDCKIRSKTSLREVSRLPTDSSTWLTVPIHKPSRGPRHKSSQKIVLILVL